MRRLIVRTTAAQAGDESCWPKFRELWGPISGAGREGTTRRAASSGTALPVLGSPCSAVQGRVVWCAAVSCECYV